MSRFTGHTFDWVQVNHLSDQLVHKAHIAPPRKYRERTKEAPIPLDYRRAFRWDPSNIELLQKILTEQGRVTV